MRVARMGWATFPFSFGCVCNSILAIVVKKTKLFGFPHEGSYGQLG
jgi:hypothetical protein